MIFRLNVWVKKIVNVIVNLIRLRGFSLSLIDDDPKEDRSNPPHSTTQHSKIKTNTDMEPSACEDLKAFERRFTEVVSSYRPATIRWRMVLVAVSLSTAIGAWYWLRDPRTCIVPFIESLLLHPTFTIAMLMLLCCLLLGIHKLVIAPHIITSRMRTVLQDFNMSCDDTGKLILKPRPN